MVGLFLASVGMFGLIKYLVERRTRELGLRIAPRRGTASAGPGPDRRRPSTCGDRGADRCAGGPGLDARLLSTVFFGIPIDPASFAGAIVVVLIVAALAGYLPERKVVAASPMVALQGQ